MTPLLRLAIPVILSLLANMGVQLVDTLFVGRLGPQALGGVSLGNAVFSTLMMVSIGMMSGLDFSVSRAYGAGKLAEGQRYVIQAFFLVTVLTLPATALMHFAPAFYSAIGVAPDAAAQAAIFLEPMSWSLWPFLLMMVFRQYLQAMGIATPALVISLITNALNIVLNWAFLFGHLGIAPMGIAGSGRATLIARCFNLVALGAYVLHRDHRLREGLLRAPRTLSKTHLGEILRLGFPSGMQMLLEVGVFATATLLAGRLGSGQLAAHQVVLQIASFTFMVPLGLSSATAVRVAQALGAGDRARAHRTGWLGIASGTAFMACSAATLLTFSRPILGLFSNDAEVVTVAASLLTVAGLFQLSDGVQVVATGALRGIGNTRASLFANLAGHWGVGLPIGAYLCFRLGWNALGLWTGLSIGLTTVAAALLLSFRLMTRPGTAVSFEG